MYDVRDIEERLERKFGLGQRPVIRRSLYRRLGELCVQKGDRAYLVICDAAEYALSRSRGDKGNCFAFVVMRRLFERGVIDVDPL